MNPELDTDLTTEQKPESTKRTIDPNVGTLPDQGPNAPAEVPYNIVRMLNEHASRANETLVN